MESINSENSQTSSADSESEDESESGYSLIAGIGSILLEKKIESEAALMYSQQMETLVGGYEVFIKVRNFNFAVNHSFMNCNPFHRK